MAMAQLRLSREGYVGPYSLRCGERRDRSGTEGWDVIEESVVLDMLDLEEEEEKKAATAAEEEEKEVSAPEEKEVAAAVATAEEKAAKAATAGAATEEEEENEATTAAKEEEKEASAAEEKEAAATAEEKAGSGGGSCTGGIGDSHKNDLRSKSVIVKIDKPRPKRRLALDSTARKASTQTTKSAMPEPSIIESYQRRIRRALKIFLTSTTNARRVPSKNIDIGQSDFVDLTSHMAFVSSDVIDAYQHILEEAEGQRCILLRPEPAYLVEFGHANRPPNGQGTAIAANMFLNDLTEGVISEAKYWFIPLFDFNYWHLLAVDLQEGKYLHFSSIKNAKYNVGFEKAISIFFICDFVENFLQNKLPDLFRRRETRPIDWEKDQHRRHPDARLVK
uniref:Uncharacterized protein n=1 Tax=Ananas comosus var. bracteatus TaxID=296719 RepID=A0A6V7QHX4_ANACO|nr:unnamed protein product [Ananas comosus var. bracteatus]